MPLLLIVATTNTFAYAHTPEYQTGFTAGLDNKSDVVCDVFAKVVAAPGTISGVASISTPKLVRCQAGYDNGQYQRALTSPEYKTGFLLAKNDTVNTRSIWIALTGPLSVSTSFTRRNDLLLMGMA
jgi:hypothetical protein